MSKVDYTQEQFQQLFFPLLKQEGQLYQKYGKIYARLAKKGEVIATITSDGLETENTAIDHTSYIVQNQTDAQESYIVQKKVFEQKYEFIRSTENGFNEYKAIGKIRVVKLTRKRWQQLSLPNKQCYFEAPWGQPMILKLYDYMVSPLDYSEVYRIARKEFWETYKLLVL